MNNKKNFNGDLYLRSRSISEPEISFDKSSINSNRFKTKHFPFEYIAVDDLHYYRRRKPYLFQSNLRLHSNNRSESLPHINGGGRTEYKQAFTEKPFIGKLPALKRPPNLKVDAFPFLTGSHRSESSLNCCSYLTEYDSNYPLRPFSPRVGMIRRPTNIKLNPGIMDIKSEQKSQFRAYADDIFTSARPAMIKKPNNLHLTGKIELYPEYREKFVPYSVDSICKSNKAHCFHAKKKESEKIRSKRQEGKKRQVDVEMMPMRESTHENIKQNYDVDIYIPEYKSKYKPIIGKRSSIIQQPCHFQKFNDEFIAVSEYNNRYKNYDQFTKSAPIKKQDNLYMRGETQMQPEYKDRYKEIDVKSYARQPSLRHQDNLYSNDQDDLYCHNVPEYSEKFKDYSTQGHSERAKGREDFLHMSGDMVYEAEYRNNYVEFPRQRAIVRKPSTHIQLSSNDRKERKPDNFTIPIDVPSYHHDTTPAKHFTPKISDGIDDENSAFESSPEYRKALKNYMLKERSPTRQQTEMELKSKEKENTSKNLVDHNDVTKILTENKVNVPEEKIFDENNEVIVERLKAPSNFKIPTRSPTKLSLGRGASYPIQQDHKFSEHTSTRTIRRSRESEHDGEVQRKPSVEFADDYDDGDENNNVNFQQQLSRPAGTVSHYQKQRPKKSPEYGRRAPKPREDYIVRKNTNIIEGNAKYSRNFQPNRHEKKGYHIDTAHPLDFALPSEPLANNYRPNYEIDKQQSYRDNLNNEPFVVLDREISNKVKQSSWMKKQWYDD